MIDACMDSILVVGRLIELTRLKACLGQIGPGLSGQLAKLKGSASRSFPRSVQASIPKLKYTERKLGNLVYTVIDKPPTSEVTKTSSSKTVKAE